ncbi:MAG: polyketide synthase, partial [Candidatus Tectomicrobia bacterium]|nr:polyketide synthase [Candidatus Tectomicrobia bacterium]
MDKAETIESGEGIAVIGMACRFPGAKTVEEFWQNLCDGVESIAFFSDDDLLAVGVDPALFHDPNYVKANGVLADIDQFDASFFGYSPREAEVMDPQHRFFLECSWEALERAGYDSQSYAGRVGVYAGAGVSSYRLHNLNSNPELRQSVGDFQMTLSTDKDFMPLRVSYKLNLTGPSVNVNTACSTSLVAVHMACQSLLTYQCDLALAGAVTISVRQNEGYIYQEGMVLSPDGHCRAFDRNAQGIVGGSGVGIVVLKRLEDAMADGDLVHAVIRGSAINNDGANKIGYTAPSVDGQAEVIAEAQYLAGVDAETISYVETHGTGTPLGDPIEIAALTRVFRAATQNKGSCAIGAVKTNIGHLDTAAGVAGLIKTVMALQHKMLPPTLHFTQPNPEIDFENSPFYVNTTLSDWKTNGMPRRAGVSSFGIGGTNAHVILEEAPAATPAFRRDETQADRPFQLLVLSA